MSNKIMLIVTIIIIIIIIIIPTMIIKNNRNIKLDQLTCRPTPSVRDGERE